MATSGTTTYNPVFAKLIEEAYDNIGIDSAEVTARHLEQAQASAELMFSSWSNKGARQWAITQTTLSLVQGTTSYTLPTNIIDVLSIVLRRTSAGDVFDTPMYRVSRSQYIEIADKTIQGRPSQYFLDRQRDAPVIYLWNTPENSTDQLVYNYFGRTEDAGDISNNLDVPYRWYAAIAAGLAARLYPKVYMGMSTQVVSQSGVVGERSMYSQSVHATLKQEAYTSFMEAKYEDSDKADLIFKVNLTRGKRR